MPNYFLRNNHDIIIVSIVKLLSTVCIFFERITKMSDYNILIIDDEVAIIELMEIYLSNEGYLIYTALNGADGLKILQENHIHLVVLDIMMPGMDGLETCQKKLDSIIPYPSSCLVLSQKIWIKYWDWELVLMIIWLSHLTPWS